MDPIAPDSGWSSAREPVDTLPIVVARIASSSKRTVNKLAPVLALATLVAGCAKTDFPSTSPFDLLGPLVNAPISAPFSPRWAYVSTMARRARRSCTPTHGRSRAWTCRHRYSRRRNLAYALEEGRPHAGVYWENPANQRALAPQGAATVVQETTQEDGRRCREMLVETELEGEQSDKRLLTYCRSEAGWLIAD